MNSIFLKNIIQEAPEDEAAKENAIGNEKDVANQTDDKGLPKDETPEDIEDVGDEENPDDPSEEGETDEENPDDSLEGAEGEDDTGLGETGEEDPNAPAAAPMAATPEEVSPEQNKDVQKKVKTYEEFENLNYTLDSVMEDVESLFHKFSAEKEKVKLLDSLNDILNETKSKVVLVLSEQFKSLTYNELILLFYNFKSTLMTVSKIISKNFKIKEE
jgi:hypothetical protein